MATQPPATLQKGKSADAKGMKRPVQEIRAEIRSYIRNERDTVLKKWMALKETLNSEDNRRDQFYERKFIEDTKSLPINVLKFIGTLKKAVRVIMRDKGGTAYSIVRNMFIYWDADRSGLISATELLACMKSLGVKVTKQECAEIVEYYRPKHHLMPTENVEMDYHTLLMDLQKGEPTLTQMISNDEEVMKASELRFEEESDTKLHRPAIVDKFIEAVRAYLQIKMRTDGGTPQQHIRFLFSFYDYDYSNGLDPKELVIASKREMNLTITENQAKQIVAYYDRKKTGQMTYEKFVVEVVADLKPILHFAELTKEEIENKKQTLAQNPFIPKPFVSAPNRVLEKFKADLRKILATRIHKTGGSVGSWIREAFSAWDRHFSGIISDPRILQGVAKRIGLTISENDAQIIMRCYDKGNTGEMHYNFFIQEMSEDDNHFIADGSKKLGYNGFTNTYEKLADENRRDYGSTTKKNTNNNHEEENEDLSSRTPDSVNTLLNRINRRMQAFVSHSHGKISNPTDILHGTFLRYDPNHTGRISRETFRSILVELKITNFDTSMLDETIVWFDSNGSNTLDYNMLVKQLFGHDVVMESFPVHEYTQRLKQLKAQRRYHMRFIEHLKKNDDPILVHDNLNHSMGMNAKDPYHRKKGIIEKKNQSKHVSNLLSTVSLNRSVTMTKLPVNNMQRPKTAPAAGTKTTVNIGSRQGTDFIQGIETYIPKRFLTDTASSQAGSLLLNPATVTNNPYVTVLNASNLILPTEFGVKQETKVKNLTIHQGLNEISQEIYLNTSKISCEKKKLEKKLNLIEEQRKQLIDEFKSTHSKESVKALMTSLQNGSKPTSSSANRKAISSNTMTTIAATAAVESSNPEVPEVNSNR
jgi:Ca2+-binding EF-hand superfamily protein